MGGALLGGPSKGKIDLSVAWLSTARGAYSRGGFTLKGLEARYCSHGNLLQLLRPDLAAEDKDL